MRTLILKGIAIDLALPIIFLVYLTVKLWNIYQGKIYATRETWGTLIVGIPLVLAFLAIDARPRIIDYFYYLRRGESYVRVIECKVDAVSYGTFTKALLGNETLWCTDGKPYRLYYSHTRGKLIKAGTEIRLYYLPKSRFVVKLEELPPIQS